MKEFLKEKAMSYIAILAIIIGTTALIIATGKNKIEALNSKKANVEIELTELKIKHESLTDQMEATERRMAELRSLSPASA